MSNKPYYAFFDVDETVINIKSMFSFLQFYYRAKYGQMLGALLYHYNLVHIKHLVKRGLDRELINREYYKLFKGNQLADLLNSGEKWFEAALRKGSLFNERVLSEIAYHKKNGAGVVLVSGSFSACLAPIAKKISADIYLGATLETRNGRCTGKLVSYPIIGEGKAKAIREFLTANNFVDTSLCYAYGDHYSDLPMLKVVGHPVVVSNCQKLLSYAKEHNWKIL